MLKKIVGRENYTVGWLCALHHTEFIAARQMLDREYDEPEGLSRHDKNTYTYGSINGHYVVIACMPLNQPGLVSAATLAYPLAESFPNMDIHLFVGIGGGIPRNPQDPYSVRLGDVVVSWPEQTGAPPVIQYDFRRDEEDGKGRLLTTLNKPSAQIINALGMLVANHEVGRTRFSEHLKRLLTLNPKARRKFENPGPQKDNLYETNYSHRKDEKDCTSCDRSYIIDRESREEEEFLFHQGTILSANTVLKNAKRRDELAEEYPDALCVEMEAAGLMDEKHCLVIRGICDYADSHKNQSWQGYAAATASAFARELLFTLQPRKISPVQETPSMLICNPPHVRDDKFTGRKDILDEIEKQLESKRLIALTGMGGVGKSHIAMEYFYRRQEKYPRSPAVWVNAGSASRFRAEFTSIARKLRIIGEKDEETPIEDVLEKVRNWFETTAESDWLLVIDNAREEDFGSTNDRGNTNESLEQYIPSSDSGHVIITTRNKDVADYLIEEWNIDGIIRVNAMSTEDAEELVRNRLQSSSVVLKEDDISALVRILNGIPLALTQATAYITKKKYTIESYLKVLRNSNALEAELENNLARGRNGGETGSVSRTWQLSFDEIRAKKSEAASLLSVMAFLDYQKIPEFLLADETIFPQFNKAMDVLVDFSFVSKDEQQGVFQMHELVQIITRKWLRQKGKPGELEKRESQALEAVSMLFPGLEYLDWEDWRKSEALVPHADKILRSYTTPVRTDHRASLLFKISGYNWRQGRFKAAIKLCIDAEAISEPPLLLDIQALKGRIFQSMMDYDNAVDVHKKVLKERTETFGDQHPDTLKSKIDLSYALCKQSNGRAIRETISMLRQALEDGIAILNGAEEDPLTSRIRIALASALRLQKDYQESEILLRKALETQKKYLGNDSPHTLATWEFLAEVLEHQGKYDEAEQEHRNLIPLYDEVLGERHPDTLINRNGLAVCLVSQGKFDDAEEHFTIIRDLYQKYLRLDPELESPQELLVMINLANALEQQKKFTEAEEICRRVLDSKQLGENDFRITNCMDILGNALQGQGKTQEAQDTWNKCDEMRENIARMKQGPIDTHDVRDTVETSEQMSVILCDAEGEGRIKSEGRCYTETAAIIEGSTNVLQVTAYTETLVAKIPQESAATYRTGQENQGSVRAGAGLAVETAAIGIQKPSQESNEIFWGLRGLSTKANARVEAAEIKGTELNVRKGKRAKFREIRDKYKRKCVSLFVSIRPTRDKVT